MGANELSTGVLCGAIVTQDEVKKQIEQRIGVRLPKEIWNELVSDQYVEDIQKGGPYEPSEAYIRRYAARLGRFAESIKGKLLHRSKRHRRIQAVPAREYAISTLVAAKARADAEVQG